MNTKKKSRKNPSEDIIPESCYFDHACISSQLGDMHFTATFTPHGIHQMENGFNEVIFNCCTTTELEGIRFQIRKNKHFHPRIKKKLLAITNIVEIPHSEIYRDMKDYRASWWPMRLTQQGIRRLDYEFTRRITDNPTPEQAESLRKEIEQNDHLHQDFKDNLLMNLTARLEELKKEVEKTVDAKKDLCHTIENEV